MSDTPRASGALLFLLTLGFLALLVHGRVFGAGNDASRFALIESLVDFGQMPIEASRYHWTIDRVTIAGQDYSNKPPLLSLFGAAIYAAIKGVTGLTFARNEAAVLYLLNLLLVALPTAWLVAVFHRSLLRYWRPQAPLSLVTLALAAGTILTSFSTTLNNHTVAAALLFAACEAAWSGNAMTAGCHIALLACIDTVPGLVFAPVLGLIVRDTAGARGLRRFAGALAAGAALFVAANLWVVDSPWPPKMVPGALDYSSSTGPELAGVLLPTSWTYPLSALFGWHGFFTVSPVLLFGAAGMARAALEGRPLPRCWIVLLAAACGLMIGGHVLFVGSFGGWSYGFRYLIPIVPLLLFFAPAVLGPVARRAFVPVLAISCLCALLGAYNPWPPADEPGTGKHPVASMVTNPVGANLAAWLWEYAPGGWLADASARLFISPDREARDRYLALFYASRGDVEMTLRMRSGVSQP